MNSTSRPLILLSNDDGVFALGIRMLHEALRSFADVVCVAPQQEQSGQSHAISLHRPLRHEEVEPGIYSLDGTPADCVYVALYLEGLLPRRPSLVVSGINHGPNLATDVHYSGTVAAAREGALRGVPAIAFSNLGMPMKEAAPIAGKMCERLLETMLPDGAPVLINVNFPADTPQGVRATRPGIRDYAEGVETRHDPRGRDYLWIGGAGNVDHPEIEGSDTAAVDNGYISVSPLTLETCRPEHFGIAAYLAGPS